MEKFLFYRTFHRCLNYYKKVSFRVIYVKVLNTNQYDIVILTVLFYNQTIL